MTAELRNHVIPHDTTPARNRALAHDAADQRECSGPTPTALYTPPVTEHAGGIVLTNQDTRIYDGDGPTMRAKVTLLVIVVCGIGLVIVWWRLGRPL